LEKGVRSHDRERTEKQAWSKLIDSVLWIAEKKPVISLLEGIRAYREGNPRRVGMKGIFPLWGKSSHRLAEMFIEQGFKAVVTCVDTKMLSGECVGREYDRYFLEDLPESVDPCGENGEFHTFVYGGPIFRNRVGCTKGEVVLRDNRFYFCDLYSG
jgi:diphthamide synthase (EF-2-diphthine--ammonia ligase)